VTYFIGEAAHHLTFIGVFKISFKHYLIAPNKYNFSPNTITKALASGCKLVNKSCQGPEFERSWTRRSEVSDLSYTCCLDVDG
jgi:hypothetical protein